MIPQKQSEKKTLQKTTLKKGVIIPKELEYHNEEGIEVDIEQRIIKSMPLFSTTMQNYSESKPKVAVYAAASTNHKVYPKET
ncbi:hypothetical protein AGMMS49574_27290 [Bacteroidia bacterium]|nr:hypothetical protein AGMMS49574_27290 [Bacteroidia bacterium]